MKFSVNLTNQEKKSIYSRALKDLERRLLEQLILEGINPDELDEDVFEPAIDEHGNKTMSQVAIKETIDQILRLRIVISEIE
jgi:hypothetical protein